MNLFHALAAPLLAALLVTASAVASPGAAVDPQALEELVEAAGAAHTSGLVIYRDGTLVGEWYFGKAPRKIEAMSATKSIVNLAVGRLVTTGAIQSIDQPVHTWYPEWKQGRKSAITLRHLLGHTSGLQNVPNTGVEIYPSPDFVRLALAAEVTDPPGTRFAYNNKAVNLLAGIVERASGRRLDRYLGEEVFAPLGITDFDWTLDEAGNPHAMAGLQILPADLAKLGLLVLERGEWQGRRLIAASWFEQSLRPASELNEVCGLLWWMLPAYTRHKVDGEILDALAAADVPEETVAALRRLEGRYEDRDAFDAALAAALGERWQEIVVEQVIGRGLELSKREYGPIVGYQAQGYLGQYLLVYPEQGLVAVRMIDSAEHTGPGDTFTDFPRRVERLAPAP